MIDFLRAILSFAFVLGVLVFIHELGHYLAAKWRRIHVDVFSIGFGKALYRWYDRTGTEWRICPIPLGGYVRPHGFHDPEDATEEEKSKWIKGKTFHEKGVLDRSIVIIAGPVFNFLLAILLFAGLFFCSGKMFMEPVAIEITPQSSAAIAGLQVQDIILKIDQLNKPTIDQFVEFVKSHPNLSTHITIERNQKQISLPITVRSMNYNGKMIGQLGLKLDGKVVKTLPMGLKSSFVTAVKETWDISVQTLVGLGQMISGQRSAKELGGPLRIAQLSGVVAQGGLSKLIHFMGILSINLGLINLFPIPILDGGRLVFYLAEGIFRRPIPKRIQNWGFQVGFAVIFLIFIFSTYNDISQLGVFRWFTSHSN